MFGLYPMFKQKASILLGKTSFIMFFLVIAMLLYPNIFVLAKAPNDPKYLLQEPFYKQINAPAAWDYTTGSSSVVVAVIDTGVDILNGDLKENIWQNLKEIPGNGLDDDNNGFVDDVNGWNFVESDNDVRVSTISLMDDSGAVSHGTILSGLIGARGDNNILGTGLNWQIKIMPIRAISSDGGGSLGNVAKAINYAVNNGADIISISFVGDSKSFGLQESLFNARKHGVLVVAAAGNNRDDGTGNDNSTKNKQYPICSDFEDSENWILGVTSVDKNDKLSDFTNFGICVDLSAPGEYVYSTQRSDSQYPGYEKNFGGPWFGSSFSAPLVAGAAALVKSARPDWKAKEIILDLLATADDIDGLNPGFAGQIGYGRLNVGRAVARAMELKPVVAPLIFESKLVKKQNKYFVRITSEGKVLHELPLPGYNSRSTKWAVAEDLLVFASQSKGRVMVNAWDWSGNKKLANLVLPGISNFYDLKIETVWGDSPNAVLSVKMGGYKEQIIIDIPSASWKAGILDGI